VRQNRESSGATGVKGFGFRVSVLGSVFGFWVLGSGVWVLGFGFTVAVLGLGLREAGSYLRLIDFVYHSTVGLRVIKKKKRV